jgi:MarR family transcriptional regulator, organic hydroperoxide resistance regulator
VAIAVRKLCKLTSRGKPLRSGSHRSAISRPLPQLRIDTSDRLAHLVKDAGKSLARALQIRLAEHAIAYGHWTFLRILWKQDGISQTELSQLAGVMTPSTCSAMQSMEKLGYIVRRQKKSNRKKIYIYLTPAGRALERKLKPLAIEVNAIATGGLTKLQIADFRNVLINIIEKLNEVTESSSSD